MPVEFSMTPQCFRSARLQNLHHMITTKVYQWHTLKWTSLELWLQLQWSILMCEPLEIIPLTVLQKHTVLEIYFQRNVLENFTFLYLYPLADIALPNSSQYTATK